MARAFAKGDATEHTHRAALQQLIESSISGLEATLTDVEHYSQVVAALGETRTLMVQADAAANGVLWSAVTQTEVHACT